MRAHLNSLASERFRTTFLAFYALSCLIPTLIVVFIFIQYVRPLMFPYQMDALADIITYGLAAMLAVPFLGFFLMSWWVNSLERLTEELRTRSAEVLSERIVINEKNELVTLHRHFDGLFGELKGKIEEVNKYSKELSEHKKKISRMAVTDELTTLYNRRYFDKRLMEEIKKAEKKKQPLGLIMLDIDGFKKYNARYGHEAGNDLLRSLGLLIRDYVRKTGIPFRYGGDEFGIIVPNRNIEGTAAAAEELTNAISLLTTQGKEKASVSCGVVSYSQALEGLILEADRCLDQAKTSGKGKVVCLTPKVAEGKGQ